MARLWTAWLWGVIAAGCIYDSSDRCGPGEEPTSAGVCECKANHVPKPRDVKVYVDKPRGEIGRDGCVPCGEDEVANGDVCDCREGLVRDENNACVEPMVAAIEFGTTCSTDTDCGEAEGATCVTSDQIAGMSRPAYCSFLGCSGNAECPVGDGYVCAGSGKTAFCRRPPTGEDDACVMAADETPGSNAACQQEANVCAFNKCRTYDCRTDDQCSAGHICCDLTKLAGRDDAYLCTLAKECPSR